MALEFLCDYAQFGDLMLSLRKFSESPCGDSLLYNLNFQYDGRQSLSELQTNESVKLSVRNLRTVSLRSKNL